MINRHFFSWMWSYKNKYTTRRRHPKQNKNHLDKPEIKPGERVLQQLTTKKHQTRQETRLFKKMASQIF
jgi:hypothetical protein